MKQLILIVMVTILFTSSCNFGKKGNPEPTPVINEMSVNQKNEFFQTLSCGHGIKGASIIKDSVFDKWHLYIEVYDTIALLPLLVKNTDINKEVSHQFTFDFRKDSIGEWKMILRSYQLHYYSVTPDTKFGLDDYCISVYGWEHGTAWICDHWKLEDFPWLKDRKVNLDFNHFANEEEALQKVSPPLAVCIYEKVKSEVPRQLR